MKKNPISKFISNVVRLLVELRKLLGHQYNNQIVWMLVLMVIVGVLDFVGVGAIYPLLSVITEPQKIYQYGWMEAIIKIFGDIPLQTFILVFSVVLLVLYIIKASITSYSTYYQSSFSYHFSAYLAHRVLKGYLSLDYSYFLTQNSSILLKNVIVETNYIGNSVLIPLLCLISDALVLFPLCMLVVAISPGIYLLTALIVVLFFAAFFFLMRRRFIEWGKERVVVYNEANRIAHQSLFGVKEVKAINCEEMYLQRLIKYLSRSADLFTYHVFFQLAPRIWIDFFIMSGLVLFVVFTYRTQVNFEQLLPTLGVYIAAFYRILPIFNRTFTNVTSITYYHASVFTLREALEGIENLEKKTMQLEEKSITVPSYKHVIRFNHVSFGYPMAERRSLYNINLEIPFGSRIAIVGASGAGKTTTVDLLLGLLQPTEGQIIIDGIPLTQKNSRSWREQIGYVSQQIFLADATVEENIAFGVNEKDIDKERLFEAIRMAGLMNVVENLEKGIKTPLGENGVRLSGGERQRIGIARALYRKPRLLVLDEATSALDVKAEHQIMKDVFSLGRDTTIVIISHRLSAVQPCDKLFFLKGGRLVASGIYDKLLKNVAEFSEMLMDSSQEEEMNLKNKDINLFLKKG